MCITNIQLVVVHNISSSSNILINFCLSNKNVSYVKLHLLVALVKMALSSSYDLRRIDRYCASNAMFLIMHMSLLVFFSCCLLPQLLSSALCLMCVQLVALLISSKHLMWWAQHAQLFTITCLLKFFSNVVSFSIRDIVFFSTRYPSWCRLLLLVASLNLVVDVASINA